MVCFFLFFLFVFISSLLKKEDKIQGVLMVPSDDGLVNYVALSFMAKQSYVVGVVLYSQEAKITLAKAKGYDLF